MTKTSAVKICWEQHLPCGCITPSCAVNKPLQTLGIQSYLYHPQGLSNRLTGYFHGSRLWLLEQGGPKVHPLQESIKLSHIQLAALLFIFCLIDTDHAKCLISVQLVMVVHCCSGFSILINVSK